MKYPTFSICIPNYNYGHFIGKTIESVLNQTYPNFEIIIADNASSDDSVKVIESFNDKRIHLIKNNYNIGFAPNLQKATMFAKNDFINLLSSDDLMKPKALETYAKIILENVRTHKDMVLISDAELIDSENKVNGHIHRSKLTNEYQHFTGAEDQYFIKNYDPSGAQVEIFSGLEILKYNLSLLRNFAPFLTIVYSRNLWQKIEGYNAVRTIGPDKFFNYKLLEQNPDVFYVPLSLYQYRIHVSTNQKSQKTNLKQQLDDYLYTLEYSDQFLSSLGLSRSKLTNSFLNRVCLKNGLTELVYGSYEQAFRMLAFALATYPRESIRLVRFYQLLGLLITGPFSKILARLFYIIYHTKDDLNLGLNK